MISNSVLIVLKYAGSLTASAYGIYATLSDFKEVRDGKRILSRKGYLGIALLLTSSVLALSTAGLKDYKDGIDAEASKSQDSKQRKEDLERVENILSGLTQVKTELGSQSTQIGSTQHSMEKGLALTTEITNNLNLQLGTSRQISENLGIATKTLSKSAAQTEAILKDNTERIPFVNVIIQVALDPTAFQDEVQRARNARQTVMIIG